jgi:glutamate dehydrogenase (NAD(P)+)
MTSARHMLWMLDEFEAIHGGRYPGFITGKPVGLGGSLGRTEATGFGLVFVLREALRELKIAPEDTRASVQGFGNVAQHAIRLYQRLGGKVVCVSSWDQEDQRAYSYRRADGIDLDELAGVADTFGGIDKAGAARLGYERLPGDAWLEQPVDILVPAALENQVRADNVGRIHPSVRVVRGEPTGPPPRRRTSCSRTAASWSCRTSWPTPAASRAATSSRCRAT